MPFSSSRLCILVLVVCAGCASAPTTSSEPGPAGSAESITTGDATIVVGKQECCPKQTLPEFLGLKCLFEAGLGGIDAIRNCLGQYYPGIEATPPLLAISDPANLESPSPAVATAADVKAQEDAARQKIKALRYLAEIGCGGCYPDVEEAFLSALDDCTESVRFEAANALREEATCDPCQCCQCGTCCSPKIRKKLSDLAYGMHEHKNCFKEPSDRVRRMARLALESCGPQSPTDSQPLEGPNQEDLPEQETVASLWGNSIGSRMGIRAADYSFQQRNASPGTRRATSGGNSKPCDCMTVPAVAQRLPTPLQSRTVGQPPPPGTAWPIVR